MSERDDFQRLAEAVMQLDRCIRSMGPSAQVAEIRLKPTRGNVGRFEVERAIKASPSFAQLFRFNADALPPAVVVEVAGVRLTSMEL